MHTVNLKEKSRATFAHICYDHHDDDDDDDDVLHFILYNFSVLHTIKYHQTTYHSRLSILPKFSFQPEMFAYLDGVNLNKFILECLDQISKKCI